MNVVACRTMLCLHMRIGSYELEVLKDRFILKMKHIQNLGNNAGDLYRSLKL